MNTAQSIATVTLFVLLIGALFGVIAWAAQSWRVALIVMGISVGGTALLVAAALWIAWGLA